MPLKDQKWTTLERQIAHIDHFSQSSSCQELGDVPVWMGAGCVSAIYHHHETYAVPMIMLAPPLDGAGNPPPFENFSPADAAAGVGPF